MRRYFFFVQSLPRSTAGAKNVGVRTEGDKGAEVNVPLFESKSGINAAERKKNKQKNRGLLLNHSLSTNLIGNFKKEDRYWKIIGNRKAYYTELWHEGESVAPPAKEDWAYNEQFGAIYFPMDELLNMTVPYTKGNDQEQKTVQCKVLHTPVRSNFWHCSIRWFNEDGDMIDQKGKWSKRMLSTARSMLVELGRLKPVLEEEVPKYHRPLQRRRSPL